MVCFLAFSECAAHSAHKTGGAVCGGRGGNCARARRLMVFASIWEPPHGSRAHSLVVSLPSPFRVEVFYYSSTIYVYVLQSWFLPAVSAMLLLTMAKVLSWEH